MRVTLRGCSITEILLAGLLAAAMLPAQTVKSGPLSVPALPKLVLKAGATSAVPIRVEIRNGYHINSNKPAEDYLIPLQVHWAAGGLTPTATEYPPPAMERYAFSPVPIAVYTSDFTITCKFRAPKTPGTGVASGRLRYQACTNNMCLPPKTVEIRLPYEIQ